MSDTSKTPISRIDKLDDTIEDINTSIDTNNATLLDLINSLTQRIVVLESQRHIVESWKEGTSWYRIWSDGWIEQGGTRQTTESSATSDVKVYFNKVFNDTNYTLITSKSSTNNDPGGRWMLSYKSKQIDYFTINIDNYNYTPAMSWYACGY